MVHLLCRHKNHFHFVQMPIVIINVNYDCITNAFFVLLAKATLNSHGTEKMLTQMKIIEPRKHMKYCWQWQQELHIQKIIPSFLMQLGKLPKTNSIMTINIRRYEMFQMIIIMMMIQHQWCYIITQFAFIKKSFSFSMNKFFIKFVSFNCIIIRRKLCLRII